MKRIGLAANMCNIAIVTLRRMVKRGDFPAFTKPSGQFLFHPEDILKFKNKYPTIKKGVKLTLND